MRKKIVYILIGLLAAGLLFLILLAGNWSKKHGGETEPVLPPGTIVLPTPNFETTRIKQQAFPVKISLREEELNLPQELPVYEMVDGGLNPAEITSIAQSLGFVQQPFITDGAIGGLTYLYYKQDANLRILPNLKIIDYKIYRFSSANLPPDINQESLINQALAFLQEKRLVDPAELVLEQFQTISVDETGLARLQQSPNVVIVTFIKKINNYPLISSTYKTGVVRVMFNALEQLMQVHIDDVSNFQPVGMYKLKTVEDIALSITDASVQSIGLSDYSYTRISDKFIQSVNVLKIWVAYIQEYTPAQKYLQPIYVLEGIALLQDNQSTNVVLYLPATKP